MPRPDANRAIPAPAAPRLHPRKRLELLEEIAADVDALEDELTARGLPRGQARAAAIRRLYPGPDAVRDIEIEKVAYHRLAARLGGDTVERIERGGLAVISLLTTVALAIPLMRLDVIRVGSAFVWVPIAAISLLVANTLRVAWGLWVREDMDACRRRSAWRVQAGLVLIAASSSAVGGAVEAYSTAGRLALDPDWAVGFALLRDVMVLVSLGLGAVVIGLTGWLALSPSLRAYESLERRLGSLFAPLAPRLVRESRSAAERPLFTPLVRIRGHGSFHRSRKESR